MAEAFTPNPSRQGLHAVLDRDDGDARQTVLPRPLRPEAQVADLFSQFLEEWARDTAATSDQVAILMHPAHLRIIGLGGQALPHIFRDLASGGGPWFVALESITSENPVPREHASDARLMRLDWLEWGRAHGYLGE